MGAIEEGQNLNFAIPIAKLRNLLSNASKLSPLAPSAESATPTPKAENNGASREETVAWLRAKLEGLRTYDSDGTEHRIKQLTVQLLSSDCELQLATSGQMDSTTVLRRYYVLLSVADKASSGSNNSGSPGIWLYFRSNIYETAETYEAGRLVRKREDKVRSIALFAGDEELANRSAKAFNHLIKLCGGGLQKEPF